VASETLAVITARGGSKRIPRKNVRPFLGTPILARVLEQVRAAQCFDEVMVSTDDEEIARLARAGGAQVPFMRSAANSDDHASTANVLLEVLAEYAKRKRQFEIVCCIYPTAVFVTPQLLRQGLELLRSTGADSVVPVARFGFPIQRALKIEAGRLAMFEPRYLKARSQDLEPAYHDAGQFYWLRTRSFLEQKEIYARHSAPLVIDESQAQDIDTEEDWRMAELKFALLRDRGQR
jgi:pseudaminic acid cytidylyltransferase